MNSTITSSTPKIIVIEGNIAAGKTTLAQKLAHALDYDVYIEPTTENPYLKRYYENPKQYGEIMQMWFLHQRYHTYINAVEQYLERGRGVILDRSIFSDFVFAKKNHLDGNISAEGFRKYLQLREDMLRVLPIPHVLLFLDVSPETCLHRILNVRQRECEAGIPLDYLTGLDQCYQEFLVQMRQYGTQVVKLTWSNFGDEGSVAHTISTCTPPREAEMRWRSLDLDRLQRAFQFHEEVVAS
eukprot:GAFH01002879.1.p1 GENE.GAFH01002879.1~~GAFH01002879.1.p1  ORF type:complete len:241 (-),score=44.72 GAFH01002879.1:244-966(-)